MSQAFIVADTFEINGQSFRQKAMDPFQAAVLWPKIVALVAPALSSLPGKDDTPKELKTEAELQSSDERLSTAIRKVCEGLGSEMKGLISQFEEVCQIEYKNKAVEGAETPDGRWMPVRVQRDFLRKHVDLIEWLVTCIRNEFADFLSENGLGRLMGTVSKFTSLSG